MQQRSLRIALHHAPKGYYLEPISLRLLPEEMVTKLHGDWLEFPTDLDALKTKFDC